MKTVYIFEPGINYGVSSWRGWTNLAVEYTVARGLQADSLVYHTTALTVWLHEHNRAVSLARKILFYVEKGFRVNLIGHSNGTRVILDGLKQAKWPKVGDVHLVCGACDSNFERNGLNNALYSGKIEKVFCYRAGKDYAMIIEDTLVGKALFQMNASDRPLGLVGPQNVRPSNSSKWVEFFWPDYGHSDCWLPKNFNNTMVHFF